MMFTNTIICFYQASDRVVINGQTCINFATHNYYNFFDNKSIENRVIEAVNKYGVGSCGPRGFYGTFGKYFIIYIYYIYIK
jgi:serine palmitoyltransferase